MSDASIVQMLQSLQETVNKIAASNKSYNKFCTEEQPVLKTDVSNIFRSIAVLENNLALLCNNVLTVSSNNVVLSVSNSPTSSINTSEV